MREPNILLDAIIDEARMSHDGLAARVNRLGARDRLVLLYDHASVRRWIRDGTIPRGRVPELICEVLVRGWAAVSCSRISGWNGL